MALRTPDEVRALQTSASGRSPGGRSPASFPNLVFEVLGGRKKGIRGQAHDIAVKLGLGTARSTPTKPKPSPREAYRDKTKTFIHPNGEVARTSPADRCRIVDGSLCIYVAGLLWDMSRLDIREGDRVTVPAQPLRNCIEVRFLDGMCVSHSYFVFPLTPLSISAPGLPIFYVPADHFPVHDPVPVCRKVSTYLTITVFGYEYSVAHLHRAVPGSLVQVLPAPLQPGQKTAPGQAPDAAQQKHFCITAPASQSGPYWSQAEQARAFGQREVEAFIAVLWVRD